MIVQVRIGVSARGSVVLMYNEDRSFLYETDNKEEVKAVLSRIPPGKNSAYFKTEIGDNNKLKLKEEVTNFKSE